MTSLPVLAESVPGSGLAGSAHDFTKVADMIAQTGGAADACVFCHLEDGIGRAQPSMVNALFSWSQKASTQSFFWSNTISQAGTRLPSNLMVWAGSSRLCLGCHGDSAPANGPVDNRYQVAYAAADSPRVDDSGHMPLWGGVAHAQERPDIGPFAGMTATLAARHLKVGMGGNLDGTHVVGVPYPYQGVPGTYNQITTGRMIDLKLYAPVPKRVKLFTTRGIKVVAGVKAGATGMECASCHDVHNKEVGGRRLLRDSAAQLCLDCHMM